MTEERRHMIQCRAEIEDKIEEGRKLTLALTEKVDEIYEILVSLKGALKALGWLGHVAKWVGIIAGAVTAVYAAIWAGQNGIHK